jgi:hypothetical protein
MLYHYTSIEKLKNILETQELWLTKISDFEDVSEFRHTVSMLCNELSLSASDHDKLLSVITKTNNLVFIGCFCSDVDRPYLWKNYGEVNIEFSKNVLMDMVRYQQRTFGYISAYSNFLNCEYCSERQEAVIKSALKQWSKENGYTIPVNDLSHLATLFKKSEFYPEQETRLVLYLKDGSPIKTLKGSHKKINYWELQFRTNNGSQPIKSITIGPTNRRDEVERDLHVLLNKHQLGNIAINHSEISYGEFSNSQSGEGIPKL